MQKKDNSKPSMDKNERKRGRPAGKNRVPLSLVERRARNAQYERERRNETADAMAQLAEAACCDPQITNPELLATVINRLQQKRESESIGELKRINDDLESQIAALQRRLESDPNFDEKQLHVQSEERTTSHSDATSDMGSREDRRPSKYRKTSKRKAVREARLSSSSSRPEFSTDSQDSDWSNHHLGKTLPSQALHPLQPPTVDHQPPPSTNELDSDKSSLSEKTSSEFSDRRQSDLMETRLKFEDSERSEQSEAFSEKSRQQDVRVEFQLLPEFSQIRRESIEEQNEISSMDPFTDGEKAILERLGWSDFINFQDAYSENHPNLQRWHVDYAGF